MNGLVGGCMLVGGLGTAPLPLLRRYRDSGGLKLLGRVESEMDCDEVEENCRILRRHVTRPLLQLLSPPALVTCAGK